MNYLLYLHPEYQYLYNSKFNDEPNDSPSFCMLL